MLLSGDQSSSGDELSCDALTSEGLNKAKTMSRLSEYTEVEFCASCAVSRERIE